MATTVTPMLQLPLIAAAQAHKEVTHNEALLRMDALLGGVVGAKGSRMQPFVREQEVTLSSGLSVATTLSAGRVMELVMGVSVRVVEGVTGATSLSVNLGSSVVVPNVPIAAGSFKAANVLNLNSLPASGNLSVKGSPAFSGGKVVISVFGWEFMNSATDAVTLPAPVAPPDGTGEPDPAGTTPPITPSLPSISAHVLTAGEKRTQTTNSDGGKSFTFTNIFIGFGEDFGSINPSTLRGKTISQFVGLAQGATTGSLKLVIEGADVSSDFFESVNVGARVFNSNQAVFTSSVDEGVRSNQWEWQGANPFVTADGGSNPVVFRFTS